MNVCSDIRLLHFLFIFTPPELREWAIFIHIASSHSSLVLSLSSPSSTHHVRPGLSFWQNQVQKFYSASLPVIYLLIELCNQSHLIHCVSPSVSRLPFAGSTEVFRAVMGERVDEPNFLTTKGCGQYSGSRMREVDFCQPRLRMQVQNPSSLSSFSRYFFVSLVFSLLQIIHCLSNRGKEWHRRCNGKLRSQSSFSGDKPHLRWGNIAEEMRKRKKHHSFNYFSFLH